MTKYLGTNLSLFFLLGIGTLILLYFFIAFWGPKGLMKVNRIGFRFGVFIFISACLNILMGILNGFAGFMNVRFSLVMFMISFLLIFFQKRRLSFLRVCSISFKVIFVINSMALLVQLALFILDYTTLVTDIQYFLGIKVSALALNTRMVFGYTVLRPVGLFGGLQGGVYMTIIGAMVWNMCTFRSVFVRGFFWLCIILFCLFLGAGQNSLISVICACTFELLMSPKKFRVRIVLLLFPLLIIVFILGIQDSKHFDSKKEDSMMSVYLDSLNINQYSTKPECFFFGCSLNIGDSDLVAEPKYRSKLNYISDNGLIPFALSIGLLYLFIHLIGILVFLKKSRLENRLKITIFTLGVAQLGTVIHYNIGWGSGVFSFLLLSFFHIEYRYIRSLKKSRNR